MESSGSLSKGKTGSLPARQVFARSHHSIYNTTCHVALHHTTADAHHMQQNALETLWVLSRINAHSSQEQLKGKFSRKDLKFLGKNLQPTELTFTFCQLSA